MSPLAKLSSSKHAPSHQIRTAVDFLLRPTDLVSCSPFLDASKN